MADLVLTRTGTNSRHITISGTLNVRGTEFFSVERLGAPTFREGVYAMQMSLKQTGRRVPCLRPVDCPFFTILIHDASGDDVRTLAGCVAPGKERDPETGGIRRSAEAMEELLDLLGGWPGSMDPNETFSLEVVNNVPGIEGDRESYWRQRVPVVRERYGVVCPLEPTPEISPDTTRPDPVPETRFPFFFHEDDQPVAPFSFGIGHPF